LQGFGLLPTGDIQSTMEAGFHLCLRRPRLPQEYDAPQTRDFRVPPAFLVLLYQGMSLIQRLEAVCGVAQVVTDVRQRRATGCDEQCCPSSPPGGDSLADLGHPYLTLPLHGHGPPA